MEAVRLHPVVRADELAERFGVSVETIRRDLVALERTGLTRRVYGGVMRTIPRSFEAPYEQRRSANHEQKRAMAMAAAELVAPDDLCILDVGTSVAQVAVHLPASYRGRILTNSILAATALADRPGVDVRTSGGRVRSGDLACYGPQAEAFFAEAFGGKAFLGSGGVHVESGLTDFYPDEVPMRRVIIDHADEVYVMADSSKLGQVAPFKVCDLDRVTAVITDDGVAHEVAMAFADAGVRLITARVSERVAVAVEA
jgi:DeoR family glycerol-3-phosphate regulon repressor